MGVFDWMLRPNPTKDWTEQGELPPFDLNARSFGFLRFGDNLEAARRIGRPEKCNYLKTPGSWCLVYTSRGYHLSFTADRFVDAFFEIGNGGEFALKPHSPKAQPLLSNGEILTMDTTIDHVRRLFGEPYGTDDEDDSHLIDYSGDPVAMEFEFNGDGKLAYWHIFEPTRQR
jgi:hypothetical protein